MSASGRCMHRWCVVCGKATLVGYFMLSPEGGGVAIVVIVALARLVVLGAAGARGIPFDSMIPYTKKR